jgi:hypothetical protein
MTLNVPAHIAARIAARKAAGVKSEITSAIVTGDGFPYPRISIRSGRYRLVEDGVETVVGTELDVIIVGVNPRTSKIYYSRPYDPNAADSRPDCLSNDGIRPDKSIASPVAPTCATCPNNVLGSKFTPSGAPSKLCADQRHMAVVPAADPSKVYALTIPVSGMKGLREYFTGLQNFDISPTEVVTTLSFDDNASYPRVTFAKKGFVSNEAIGKVDELVADNVIKEITRTVPLGTFNKALGLTTAPAQALPETVAASAPVAAEDSPPFSADEEDDANTVAPSSEIDAAVAKLFG